jgi:hypothetical protein
MPEEKRPHGATSHGWRGAGADDCHGPDLGPVLGSVSWVYLWACLLFSMYVGL